VLKKKGRKEEGGSGVGQKLIIVFDLQGVYQRERVRLETLLPSRAFQRQKVVKESWRESRFSIPGLPVERKMSYGWRIPAGYREMIGERIGVFGNVKEGPNERSPLGENKKEEEGLSLF